MPGILLVCEGDQEVVSVNQHVYKVTDGFCLVDVTPYTKEPYNDAWADASLDATDICNIFHSETNFNQVQRHRVFRPARKDETQRWLADERNRALYAGVSVDQLHNLELESTARLAAQAQAQADAAVQAAARQKRIADDAATRHAAEKAAQEAAQEANKKVAV